VSRSIPSRVSPTVVCTDMDSVLTVVFTAPQKWVDRLLASTPKSARILLRMDSECWAFETEIEFGSDVSRTSLPLAMTPDSSIVAAASESR